MNTSWHGLTCARRFRVRWITVVSRGIGVCSVRRRSLYCILQALLHNPQNTGLRMLLQTTIKAREGVGKCCFSLTPEKWPVRFLVREARER